MDDLTIVTGGAGFIGSHLVDLLVASGARVRVLEKPGASVDHLPEGVEVVYTDIRERAGLADALRDGRWVYHLAANPNLWAPDPAEFDRVNHRGTVHVIESALEAGAERILHTSTESILTRPGRAEAIDEDITIEPEDTVGPYCRSKLMAERFAFDQARAGHPIVVANPTMPVGPGDRGLSPPTRLIRDFCQGRLSIAMDCTLNLIDVRDAALGLVRVMERGVPGRRFLLGGHNLTLMEMLDHLGRLTGIPSPRWRVPYPIGLGVAVISEFWSNHVSGRMPIASVTGLRLTRRLMHFDPARSLQALDLVPRSLDESLRDAVDWLRAQDQIGTTRATRKS